MYRKILKRKTYLYLAISWTTLTTILSMISNQNFKKTFFDEIFGLDKIGHLTFYLILFFLWALFTREKYDIRKAVIISFVFAVGFGIAMEICQKLYSQDRQFDLLDALANTVGAIFGVFLFLKYEKFFPIFAKSN